MTRVLRHQAPNERPLQRAADDFRRAQHHHQAGRLSEARSIYGRLLKTFPQHGDVLRLAGLLETQDGQYRRAVEFLTRARDVNPGQAETYMGLGMALMKLGRSSEAIDHYRQAIALKGDYAEAHYNLANALNVLDRFEESLSHFRRALELTRDPRVSYNYACALDNLKRHGQALAAYEEALAGGRHIDFLLGSLLHCQAQLARWRDFGPRLNAMTHELERGELACPAFPVITLIGSARLQQAAIRGYVATAITQKPAARPPARRRSGKLRIGYFSADFRDHPACQLFIELFEAHDRERFEIYAFSFGPASTDPWRQRASRAFDQFHDVRDKSAADIAALARDLEIDIAIDMNGYTTHERKEIFVHRAAPVQVSFVGFAGTMGVDFIDYIMGDRFLIPPETRAFYDEKVVYLPHCYMPTASLSFGPSETKSSRAEYGLPDRAFVFASFNNSYKILPERFAIWMRILRRVENSVLWLLVSNEEARANLVNEAEAAGIDRSRIIFMPRVPLMEHLSRMRLADLMLDTFPCGAHTTCTEAIRMGLPVLTQVDEAFASRVAGSVLHTVSLDELIVHSSEDYERLAVTIGRDQSLAQALKSKLAENAMSSPLFDVQRYARNVEAAYRLMHEKSLCGEEPDHIEIVEGPEIVALHAAPRCAPEFGD